MRFFEPVAGQAVKEAFTRLGYPKQINSHEDAIHHFVCLPTAWFREVALQTHLLSLVFTKSSSVLSTCVFSRRSKFTVYCTQNSGWLKSFMNIYHMFSRWMSGSTSSRKSTYDTSLPLGACIEGVVWGRD